MLAAPTPADAPIEVAAAPASSGGVSLVGTRLDDLGQLEWLQGSWRLGQDRAVLLVFWELWCPHCRSELPKLQSTWEAHQRDGLAVVGVTRASKGVTAEQVLDFAKQKGVAYPLAKDAGGTLSSFFQVSGVPAAAVVVDGKVVWRGHPATLDDAQLRSLIR